MNYIALTDDEVKLATSALDAYLPKDVAEYPVLIDVLAKLRVNNFGLINNVLIIVENRHNPDVPWQVRDSAAFQAWVEQAL